jgi:hypothetical protein
MPSTIRDLSELTTVDNSDFLLVSDTSDVVNRDKRITRLNLVGTNITGGGSINTGGFNATIPASGNVVMKTTVAPSAGAAVRWADGNTIEGAGVLHDMMVRKAAVGSATTDQLLAWNDSVNTVKSTGIPMGDVVKRIGTVTTAGHVPQFHDDNTIKGTLIPYTDLVLRTGAQSIAGVKTFSNVPVFTPGINVGGGTNNMTFYDSGSFTPIFNFPGGAGGHTTSTMTGAYVRIGTMVLLELDCRLTSLGTATGQIRFDGMPYPPSSNRSIGTVRWTNTGSNFVNMIVQASSGLLMLYGITAASATLATVVNTTHLTNTSTFLVSVCYVCAA